MKLALLYGQWCLSFRKSLDFEKLWTDSRGLTGSELGCVRTAEELAKLGHDVHLFTVSKDSEWRGVKIHPVEDIGREEFDCAISFNEPDLLRRAKAGTRVCEMWLNSFDFCKLGFEKHVDIWTSPSDAHREMICQTEHDVELLQTGARARYRPDPAQWKVVPLGCDPERYEGHGDKVPGRVVYCSSPDRGLHWVLQEWPHIKRAVPHATLKIFYRLGEWIRGFGAVDPAYPPTAKLYARALYIEEALRRLRDPKWGIEVCDSVSREQIEREMALAECLAYPVDTVRWSEGFSCSTLEACAAGACPVIFDCDALGSVYGGACVVVKRGDVAAWRGEVIKILLSSDYRESVNEHAQSFARKLTWSARTQRLLDCISGCMTSGKAAEHPPTNKGVMT